ncbi:Protein AmpE [Zhongshania aliphaticivorans]|uniref:Protein AmpE n=1 Tax=Zhongshania aliphaticivorans TaxID=1470434 RepID=A0A5S9N319_9GAMM|nr:regulatory signaling modulator protein AmpE [Zhongshania aliphaticivorans]CAA0082941.1 Protein AmpE [Zhongshania aliphaticivorans]CAA0083854.1 Protein AmpE [Zhongshania aliphaticivorans]
MEFFAILIAWAAVQFWGSGGVIQEDAWFLRYRDMTAKISNSTLRLLVLVALPMIGVFIVLWLLAPILFGLPVFLLSVAILLYCLGRGDFQVRLKLYLNSWQRTDLEGAYQHGRGFSAELCEVGAENALELHNSVRKAVFYQGFERWFAVVFWFVLAGPAAALAYRLLFLLANDDQLKQDDRNRAATALFYLEWLPVRILGFAFAIVGNFDTCIKTWRESVSSELPSADLLDKIGMTALPEFVPEGQVDGEQFVRLASEELLAVQHLLSRSLLVWVCAVAIVQLV